MSPEQAIYAALAQAFKRPAAIPSRSRIVSEEEYYADVAAPRSRTPLPPVPPDTQAAIDKAFASLAAIIANAPPSKPGRHPLCPGMIQYDVVRLRNGDITFLPAVGTVLVTKALRELAEDEAAKR